MIEFFRELPGLRSGIGRSFILYILLFSSIVTFIGTGLQLYFDFNRDLKSIHTTFKQVESSYLNSITNSLWLMDNKLLQIQLEGILRLPDVQFIEVRKDGEILHMVGTLQSKSIIEQTTPLVFIYDGQAIHLGEMHVVASLKGIYARIFDRVLVILSIQTIKTFLVSLFIFLIFYQLVGRYIIHMASFVESICFEPTDQPLRLDRKSKTGKPDELDLLVTSFNQMQENLIKDIIRREITEKELRQSEKDLKASQQIAHLGSWHLDLATNQVIWTEELYKMYGFDPTLPPPPYTEHMKLFTPESWEKLSTSVAKTIETGIHYELELQTIREDGGNGWMWVQGVAVKDSEGNAIGLWGAAQDITDRKNVQIKIYEKEKDLRLSLDAAKAGTWKWDILTGEVIWDDQMQRIFGLEPGKFDGTFDAWKERVHPDDIQSAEKNTLEALNHGKEV